jgi:hypothetical protein
VLNSFMGHASANKDTQNVRLHIMLLPQLTAYDLHSKPSSTSTYILKICERARSALKQSTMRKQTGAQLPGEESLRHCAMPALNKGRLEACWRLAEGLRAKRLLNFPINFLPVIGYPANARKAAGKMPLEGKHDTERTSCLSSSTHSPSFAQQNSHPLPFRQTFPYFMPTY